MVDSLDLPIEFHVNGTAIDDRERSETIQRLSELSHGHKDVLGAAVTVEGIGRSERPRRYEATVVVDMRSEPIVADSKGATAQGALKDALDAVERQVRDRRQKLGETWKRHDLRDREDE